MHLDLTLSTVTEYADQVEREVDYEEEGIENAITMEEGGAIQKIITCEISIHLCRNVSGICGINADTMREIRSSFIAEYEAEYKRDYILFNDYD